MSTGPVLFCGDPHGKFRHIVDAAERVKASAVVLLGDMEPARPLHEELAPLIDCQLPLWFIHGNHDADSEALWTRVWGSSLADRNIHGRVVELPDGRRIAGLGGIFRESVWYPSASAAREGVPLYRTRAEHAEAVRDRDGWQRSVPLRHWGSIYPEEVDALADIQADILITHEAPGYHRMGFALLDTLAQTMGATVLMHGHHHDRLDSSSCWAEQGFRSYGVGLRGITAIDRDGHAKVIVEGELDAERSQRHSWFGGGT